MDHTTELTTTPRRNDAASSSLSDPDTCRICRGEGSPDEPLFYPCKCSGSIKYVHQDCLMEWLSHSQKKHCELCKTPFRFTKLYAPDMPKTVPFHVFVSHITKYILRNMLVWARAGLVLMVWLIWLPYLMRRLWSTLFWLSDDGLGPIFDRSDATAVVSTSGPLSLSGTATCPSSPLLAQTTSAANLCGIMNQIQKGTTASTTTSLYGINITTDHPLSNMLLSVFLGSFYVGGAASRSNASVVAPTVAPPPPSRPPTLLSDVGFLQKLSSSSPGLGNFAIDVLEGQIITIVVIICFILIILVRDYVVQQQPDINMRAAFAAADNQVPVPGAGADADPGAAQAPDTEQADMAQAALARIPDPPFRLEVEHGDEDDGDTSEDDFGTQPFHHPRDRIIRPPPVFAEADARPGGPAAEDTPLYRLTAGEGPPSRGETADNQDHEARPERYVGQSTLEEQDESSGQDDGQTTDKGKQPLNGDATAAAGEQSHQVRPRSATDGPQRTGGVNPLGHNNWAFSDLPSDSLRNTPSASRQLPAADTAGSSSHAWNYITPPSSAVAESTPSSTRRRTPSPSDNDEIEASGMMDMGRDVGHDDPDQQDWEEMSEGTDPQLAAEQQLADDPGAEELPPEPLRPAGLAQRVADFMWRDVEAIPAHELPPLPEVADDFFDHDQDDDVAMAEDPLQQPQERDPEEVLAVAAAAGIDAEAEAIEDAEDLEGILELLGMRGPIAGLFQNALFCAFLVSITLFLGVFFPYNLGRTAIWLVANPSRPIRILFSLSKVVQDTAMLLMGFVSTVLLGCMDTAVSMFRPGASQLEPIRNMVHGSWNMTGNAADRLVDSFFSDLPFISTDEVRNFSIVSHAALLTIKSQMALVLATLGKCVVFFFGGDYITKALAIMSWTAQASSALWQGIKDVSVLASYPGSWVIDLSTSDNTMPLNPELATWSAMDRVCAILGGYVTMCVVAALYLGRGSPIAPGRVGIEWEATLIDALVQASGVMKVILIIGIEMLIFPLYCGLLLDVALLPLFEDTTILSRVMFTVNYPLTSIFVHWFVGTGYMFHFALFVSMCRKIMRKGVLCKSIVVDHRCYCTWSPANTSCLPDFIRDPDDAEFHPVRDVLERNVTTQLRKILFSAFVYGALVIVCLGGVVWALSYGLDVLPIYYSSNEPVLEFPIDLLFYNFLMPLAVKVFKPSDGLHTLYTWWFRKLARALRLTWFLFGERRVDEEGTLQFKGLATAKNVPWWRRVFLEVDGRDVVPKTWKDTFEGGHSKPGSPLSSDRLVGFDINKAHLVKTGQIIPDGRFVRAPASDQVKIPKGQRVFFEVTEHNERQDGKPDRPGTDTYSTASYQFVYVPPNFRLRIFLFILFIWIFAAVTGLGFTIIPLIFGRWMFRLFIPADIRTNDIYAFSIGLYILGSALYFAYQVRGRYDEAKDWALDTASHLLERENLKRAADVVLRAAKLVYAYFFLLVVFPFMVASLLELYVMIPLDTYMYGNVASDPNADAAAALPRHTVKVMQSWTIGVLYLKLAARFVVHWHRESRVAAATRAVLRRGWLEPDVKVLTRAFVVPGVLLWLVAVFAPLMVAKATIWYATTGPNSDNPLATILVYRFCFVAALLCVAGFEVLRGILGVFRGWRVRIKDEAYLIGERLHNFSMSPHQAVQHDRDPERRQHTRVGWE